MVSFLFDKYFEELGDYNKDLLPHKQAFWYGCSTLHLNEFLTKLSFNLNSSTSNFRWGKRYFSTSNKRFTWTSSSDGKIKKYYYDREEHIRKSYDSKVYFTDEMIHDHFFGCFSPNRKIGFYYKSDDKEELDEYSNALLNMYKINGKTYGSSQQLNSNVLLIDIDNYDDRHAISELKKFMEHFNIKIEDLIFIEQNAFTGGIHTALVLPHHIDDGEFYPKLMKDLKDKNINIECNFINNILRFPLSYEYVAIKHSDRIFNYEEFIPSELWEPTFKEFLLNLNSEVCSSYSLNKYIVDFFEKKKNKNFNCYENYWKTQKQVIINETSPHKRFARDSIKFKKITAGNRWEVMKHLIPFAKGLGYDLGEIIDIIYNNTESSKDLARWSPTYLFHNISKFYSKCNIYINIDMNKDLFVSNYKNIPNVTREFLEKEEVKQYLINKFIRTYNKLRSKEDSFNCLSKEKIEILKKLLPLYYLEIFGLMYYSLTQKKKFIDGINEELGFQVPNIFLERLQADCIKRLNINSPLAKTSLQYLKKTLLLTLGLEEIKYRNRARNWMLGSCKSYRVKSVNDINNILQHMFNSINSTNVIKDFYINSNNYNFINNEPYILFISPEGNKGFEENGQKLLEKIEDPPPKNLFN